MKNIILVFSFLFLGVTIQSQEVKKDKNLIRFTGKEFEAYSKKLVNE